MKKKIYKKNNREKKKKIDKKKPKIYKKIRKWKLIVLKVQKMLMFIENCVKMWRDIKIQNC